MYFSPTVEFVGDVCGYDGYKGSVDGVFTEVSCDSVGGHCDIANSFVEAYDGYDYTIYLCQCRSGWMIGENWKTCIKRSKSISQFVCLKHNHKIVHFGKTFLLFLSKENQIESYLFSLYLSNPLLLDKLCLNWN